MADPDEYDDYDEEEEEEEEEVLGEVSCRLLTRLL